MDPNIYKILHLLGILMVFTSYGALIARARSAAPLPEIRKLGAITSGVGLLLIFVSGFGLKAHLYFGHGFMWVKLLIWVALGALIMWINRKPQMAPSLFWITLALGFVAIVMAYAKPF